MHPDIAIGSWHTNAYWLIVHISFGMVVLYSYYVAVHLERISPWTVLLFSVLLFFVHFWGGSIVPFFYGWDEPGVLPTPVSEPWQTGRYFHSALLAALFFLVFYIKMIKRPLGRFLDYFAVGACMMSA